MAWTNISNGLVAVGAKPFATTIQALRDNPIAIADGATGAPRVRGAAIATPDSLPTLTVAAGSDVSLSGSAKPGVGGTANNTTSSTSLITVLAWTFPSLTGACRVSFAHRSSDAGSSSVARVELNDVLVQEWSTNSVTNQNRTVDVTFVAGDKVAILHRITNGAQSSVMTGISVAATDGYIQRNPLVRYTERDTP